MKIIVLVYAVTLVSVLSGCSTANTVHTTPAKEFAPSAKTTISSFVDPDFRTVVYDLVLVRGNGMPISLCNSLEAAIALALSNDGLFAVQNLQVFPPTREFDAGAQIKSLEELRIDAILDFKLVNVETEKREVAGHTFEKPIVHFEAWVVDIKSRRKAWMAECVSTGNAFTTQDQVIDSFTEELPKQVRASGLVKR